MNAFVRNAWYVVAWSHEVDQESLFARTVLGEPLLIYRKEQGEVVILEDRCCHRHAPLSHGRKEGDGVRCGYHGLKFDCSGVCVEVPGLSTVPPKARVHAYPAVEHHRWIFVWMGDPALASLALLPANHSCDHPDWCYVPGYLHYPTPWELIADNLLDFSHLSFVHAITLGGSDDIARTRPTVESIERGVRVSRRVPAVPAPPYYQPLWDCAGLVDRWIDYDFILPGILLMRSGARPAGAAPDDDTVGVRFDSCQALTPETAQSTHYFFQEAHHVSQGDAQTRHALFQGLSNAFQEDLAMVRAQAANVALRPDLPMLPLAMDSALLQFRRVVAQALEAERSRA